MNNSDLIFDCQVKQSARNSDALHGLDFKTILMVSNPASQLASIFWDRIKVGQSFPRKSTFGCIQSKHIVRYRVN